MNQEDRLRETVGKKNPFKVPENYFETFRSAIENKLPPYPEKPVERRVSAWQRFKPYVYLAAMFAGIWCMMKVFHNVSQNQSIGVDNFQDKIALVMNDQETMDFYTDEQFENDIDLEEEVLSMYSSIDELEKDFMVVDGDDNSTTMAME